MVFGLVGQVRDDSKHGRFGKNNAKRSSISTAAGWKKRAVVRAIRKEGKQTIAGALEEIHLEKLDQLLEEQEWQRQVEAWQMEDDLRILEQEEARYQNYLEADLYDHGDDYYESAAVADPCDFGDW